MYYAESGFAKIIYFANSNRSHCPLEKDLTMTPVPPVTPIAPSTRGSGVWLLLSMLVALLLALAFMLFIKHKAGVAPVAVAPVAQQTTRAQPVQPPLVTNFPSKECGGALQFGCVTLRGDGIRLVGNTPHQWGEYTCRVWGPKSLVCDLDIASSGDAIGRIWLVRGNGPRGPVTSIGRNPPESP